MFGEGKGTEDVLVLVRKDALRGRVLANQFVQLREATEGKIEREHFAFPEFSVWLLERQ